MTEPKDTAASPEARLHGYIPADDPQAAARANVAFYLKDGTVPFLIMHGDADTRLGAGQSERLHAAMDPAGVDNDFHLVPGANHAGPEFEGAEVIAKVRDFLKRKL